ncbi:hypothetical protein J6590_010583 [Homalodisca vitripennis]|nr:hypothetical protein J6590_010583 [Homalodisca vitripennis]
MTMITGIVICGQEFSAYSTTSVMTSGGGYPRIYSGAGLYPSGSSKPSLQHSSNQVLMTMITGIVVCGQEFSVYSTTSVMTSGGGYPWIYSGAGLYPSGSSKPSLQHSSVTCKPCRCQPPLFHPAS